MAMAAWLLASMDAARWCGARILLAVLAAQMGATTPASAGEDPVLCTSQRFAVEAGELAYRACGSGQSVILLPGGPGLDASYMQDVAAIVAANGYQAVLLELRGTGASRPAIGDGKRLTVAGSVADVEALRVALGENRVALIGHSFGGAIAQAYAAAHPSNVSNLILMDSAGPDLRPSPVPLDGWRNRLSPQELADYDSARARGDRLAAIKIKFVGSFYHRELGLSFVRRLTDASVNFDVMPLSQSYVRDYDVKPAGRQAEFAVTLLSGEIDWIRGHEPALVATYPHARSLIVPQAGHFPWIDAPAATRQALSKALRNSRPSDG